MAAFEEVSAKYPYDLLIGDEAYEITMTLGKRPELKKAPFAMIYDFVGLHAMTRSPLERLKVFRFNWSLRAGGLLLSLPRHGATRRSYLGAALPRAFSSGRGSPTPPRTTSCFRCLQARRHRVPCVVWHIRAWVAFVWRGHFLPRLAALLLVIGAVLTLPIVPSPPRTDVLLGVAWLGLALLTGRGAPAQRPPRVS